MRKSLLTIILAACLLSAGCSGASENGAVDTSSDVITTPEADTAQPEDAAAATTTVAEPEDTTAATTTATTQQQNPAEPAEERYNKGNAEEITLSGNPSDSYYIEEDCYALTDRAVFYIQKGVTIKGDMLASADKVMDDLCEVTGLDFSVKYSMSGAVEGWLPTYFGEDSFADMNVDGERVNIFIADFSDIYVQWADHNMAALDPSDLDIAESGGYTAYHELSHVIYLNNGVQLGSTLGEGAAELTAEKALKLNGRHIWNWAQHYYPAQFDETPITNGSEGFDYSFAFMDDRHYAYGYGLRLLKYLEEAYGEDIYVEILNEATAQDFSASYDPENEEASHRENTEELKSIFISCTSETVFEDFAAWYSANWSGEVQEFYDYMVSIGEEMF